MDPFAVEVLLTSGSYRALQMIRTCKNHLSSSAHKVLWHKGIEGQSSIEIENQELHRWFLLCSFKGPFQTLCFAINIEGPWAVGKLHNGSVILLHISISFARSITVLQNCQHIQALQIPSNSLIKTYQELSRRAMCTVCF